MKSKSVLVSGLALLFSRVAGMGLGFIAFLLIAWQSQHDLGVFRTVMTYIAISDLLPMLGVHTWVAAVIGGREGQIRSHALAGGNFALIISVGLGAIYFVVASQGVYTDDISNGLYLVLWMLPASAVMLSNSAVLVGIGLNDQFAKLVVVESILRFIVCVTVVVMDGSVFSILAIYVGIRWLIVSYSSIIVIKHTKSEPWSFNPQLFKEFVRHAPVFSFIMIAALITRYAAAVLVPALHGAEKAGILAASYQIYDLTLVGSTVLCTSLNHTFAVQARYSMVSLMRNVRSAIIVLSSYIFPVTILASALAEPLISTIYKANYENAVMPLRLLLLAAILASVDQIIAIAIVAAKHQKLDLRAGVCGAIFTILLSYPLVSANGLEGPALVLLIATAVTLGVRILLIRRRLGVSLFFWFLLWRPLVISVLSGIAIWSLAEWLGMKGLSAWVILLIGSALGGLLILAGYYLFGVFRPTVRRRVRNLMLARQTGAA